ncbi:RIPK2 [Branchiostoma lanceolatum]|uniref:RIPK2 protein n=1 Tax=Branchiostoma lanceolatum TaxID=7740 RepID=A0A8J9ZBU1_BRALA|nr:RIPK2 [Branchiostoma lanceolatum]
MSRRENPRVTVDDNFPVIEFDRLDFPAESYLGHGGFAAVARARHRDWKQEVAVKRLLSQPTEGSERPLLYSEARKLNLGGRSTCIISLLGVCLEPHFAIVMPYMENGSLARLLRDVDVPWALRWRMTHEISLGMTFLHCQNPQILHCDLKAENVLLDDDFHAKISDFGLSKWRTESRVVTSTSPTGATITHAPPEYITDINLVPTTKFDLYSFGVLLWEIITRRKPYENAMNSALIELAVRRGQRPDMGLVPTNVPDVDTVSQLMQTCWSQNPDDRPSFMECEDQLRAVKNNFRKEAFHEAIIYIMEGTEQRNAREAELKAKEKLRDQVKKQARDLRMQRETIQKMEQQHHEQLKQEEGKRHALEKQTNDLKRALVEERAQLQRHQRVRKSIVKF